MRGGLGVLSRGSEYPLRASRESQGGWVSPAQSARSGFGTNGGLCPTKAGPGSHRCIGSKGSDMGMSLRTSVTSVLPGLLAWAQELFCPKKARRYPQV